MEKIRLFISSVQSEFSDERRLLADYIGMDALLGRFFDVFLFEDLPAYAGNVREVYLSEVARSSIYIGLFGMHYGYEDEDGISPTEREFDHAGNLFKSRYVYIRTQKGLVRHPKEVSLIRKAEGCVVCSS